MRHFSSNNSLQHIVIKFYHKYICTQLLLLDNREEILTIES